MDTSTLRFARRELILGGQKSGKSSRAERQAMAWLAADAGHRAVLIATGQANDPQMSERIARHRRERMLRVPALVTVEEPLELGPAIVRHSTPKTLVLIDCLTLWLTNRLMPSEAMPVVESANDPAHEAAFFLALGSAPGPVVIVSNEIGLGVIPLGREVRDFVDALGVLNQRTAAACDRVTLMVSGMAMTLKEGNVCGVS